jgi:hypothetical protein
MRACEVCWELERKEELRNSRKKKGIILGRVRDRRERRGIRGRKK